MRKLPEEPFAIDGKTFATRAGTWRARLVNRQDPAGPGRACYTAEFRRVEEAAPARSLNLWIADDTQLFLDRDHCESRVFDYVSRWLETELTDSEITLQVSKDLLPTVALWRPQAGRIN
jgi:hypothetical protein